MGKIKLNIDILPKDKYAEFNKIEAIIEFHIALSEGVYIKELNNYKFIVYEIFEAETDYEAYAYDGVCMRTRYFRNVGSLIKFVKRNDLHWFEFDIG